MTGWVEEDEDELRELALELRVELLDDWLETATVLWLDLASGELLLVSSPAPPPHAVTNPARLNKHISLQMDKVRIIVVFRRVLIDAEYCRIYGVRFRDPITNLEVYPAFGVEHASPACSTLSA